MNKIEQKYLQAKSTPSTINEHIETLMQLASECNHVTEFGVQYVVSTWAFLFGCKGKVVSYDRKTTRNIYVAQRICKEEHIDWTFIQANDLEIEIEPTDMLFIDTFHNGEHLQKELDLHADKARKYIVFHDTVTYGQHGRLGRLGLWPVVMKFIEKGVWKIKKHYTNCHGLTVLERVSGNEQQL
jgi:hypothetical protein